MSNSDFTGLDAGEEIFQRLTKCEKCKDPLPDRYHLRICPKCRRESLYEVQNVKSSKYKLVFFDGDGVLFDTPGYEENNQRIALSSWNVVFHKLGIYDEHEKLKEKFLKHEFRSYMEWTDAAVRVLQQKGLHRNTFKEIIYSRPLMPGAFDTIWELRQKRAATAVITGSFHALAARAKRILSLDYAAGHCKLNFDSAGRLKSWDLVPCDFDGKVIYFKKIADIAEVAYSECAYVGDNVNDIPIFKEVGLAIAFNATKEEVRKAADVVIEKKDLREILQHLI